MTSLVTGAAGFIGSWLVDHLNSRGDKVLALTRRDGDVMDRAKLGETLRTNRPGQIFHLAAQSLPGRSWENPCETMHVNVEGTLNLLEEVRGAELDAAIVAACSSSEYAADDKPIDECGALDPSSPYALSKLAVDHAARLYASRYNLRVVRVRPFFLIGPRKSGDVCSDLARRVVAIERGQAAEVSVGRLDIVRDFLDVRDGVSALGLLAEKGKAGDVYNICSGIGHSIGDVLTIFKKLARVPIREEEDALLLRPLDEPKKVGDPSKLKALGWSPRYSLEESAAVILEYWRCKS